MLNAELLGKSKNLLLPFMQKDTKEKREIEQWKNSQTTTTETEYIGLNFYFSMYTSQKFQPW